MFDMRHQTFAETSPPPGVSNRADQSAPVPTPGESSVKSHPSSMPRRKELYKRREVCLTLGWIVNGHERVEPTWRQEAHSYAYPELDKLLGNPVAGRLLEELASEGLLERYTVDDLIECPRCNSGDQLHDRYLCLFCDSSDLRKGTLIEHYSCGHVDFAARFSREGSFVCPKCSRPLKLIGADYRRIENVFRCEICKRDSSVPKVVHVCTRCSTQFGYEQASLQPVYGYKFVERLRGEVVANCIMEGPLIEFFRAMGFSVEAPEVLAGLSGVEHVFDAVGRRDSELVVFSLASDPHAVDEQAVLTYFAKVFDVRPTRSVLIATPALTPRAKRLADLYKIQTFEGENPTQIIEQMKKEIAFGGKAESH